MEEEKFLKDKIDKEDIKVPDSLLPENIGALLHKEPAADSAGHGRKAGRTMKRGLIYRIAAAAAVVVVVLGVAGVSILSKAPSKNGSTAGGEGTVKVQTYEEIYRKMNGSGISNLIDNLADYLSWGINMKSDVITEEAGDGMDFTMASNDIMSAPESMQNGVSLEGINTGDTGAEEFSATNLQELGVDEGDIYKTDGKYIYILKKAAYGGTGKLVIVEADHGKLTKVSETEFKVPGDYDTLELEEMYVDGDRLAVVGTISRNRYYICTENEGDRYEVGTENNDSELTFAQIYDISDRSEPKELDIVKQSGYYISSRKSDGVLYLFSSFNTFGDSRIENYNSYIPLCDEELVDAGSVYCPEEIIYKGYTVIGSVNFENPDGYIDTEAVMLNSRNMYVSQNAIYFMSGTTGLGGERERDNKTYAYYMSDLVKFTYDKGQLTYVNAVRVPGSADSQFSFSEYQGKLRIVTTSSRYVKYSNAKYYDYDATCTGLYIFDEDMTLLGSIEDLAQGESVKSSRFIGNMAYFVTFRQTDPLFTVDVSDPADPVILSELKVSGFSEYMHPYGDGRMLGIGYEADESTGWTSCLKLSMFDISDGGDVTEESRLLLEKAVSSGALYNHKLVLINPEKNIFGFVSTCQQYNPDGYWTDNYELYQLFTYDEEQGFVELLSCKLSADNFYSFYDRYNCSDGGYVLDYARALYIGDYLYILDYDYGIEIYDLTDYSYVGKWIEE